MQFSADPLDLLRTSRLNRPSRPAQRCPDRHIQTPRPESFRARTPCQLPGESAWRPSFQRKLRQQVCSQRLFCPRGGRRAAAAARLARLGRPGSSGA
jgi:hypothetical protein